VVRFADKAWFITALVKAGVRDLEIGAFVRPDKVPRMADTEWIYDGIRRGRIELGRARGWSLVPNLKGLERAQAAGARNLAIFTAASEGFNRSNIGMSVAGSLRAYVEVVAAARARDPKVRIRGYVSTAFGCPFDGKVRPRQALRVIERLAALGVEQVSIGDTIGVATPNQVDEVVTPALRLLGTERVAVHFHDTRGTALANSLRAIEVGARTVDASAGGLGGCPFAPGATGNLATEDLVYMLDGLGLKSGIDLEALARVSLEMARRMRRPLSSRYLLAFSAACARKTRR
jgi:hydroxymethylglutaryl-CoA lyase